MKDSRRREMLESALCHAVYWYHLSDAFSVLLEFGVDPNVETTDETQPLVTVAMGDDIDLAELLLDAGADVNTPGVLATAAEITSICSIFS